MRKSNILSPLSLAEKASIACLLLFTGAAFISQILVMQGAQVIAQPEQAYLAPFTSFEHFLGTDQLGRDVLSYLFLSCRTAWLLAIPPLVAASLIGVALGTIAALVGNSGWKIPMYRFFSLVILLLVYATMYPIIHFWPVFAESSLIHWAYYGSTLPLLYFLLFKEGSSGNRGKGKSITLAFDEWLQKIINVWSALPKLLLLLLLTAFTHFSLGTLMGWICATYWVLPARIARASVLQLKKDFYYESAQALGIPFHRVFTHFIAPSLKGPILTNFCFAASGLLGVGSTLAYLGIGIPPDVPSWGKMLANARYSIEAWWLLAFPATFLLASIFSLQVLGNRISAHRRQESVIK
ncbi:ABC transporter permease [Rufibacter hautae]|uniref:ABC transporter permease n=1 Tax=Rufibacter hautae TaxID=2595005 RepID=A0A5B6TBW1_9BACT|nr:ABC transporter permease subunit [Rufibacter hautae]KAA3437957.1 ABC transporter permease [Rufibacter hautae]